MRAEPATVSCTLKISFLPGVDAAPLSSLLLSNLASILVAKIAAAQTNVTAADITFKQTVVNKQELDVTYAIPVPFGVSESVVDELQAAQFGSSNQLQTSIQTLATLSGVSVRPLCFNSTPSVQFITSGQYRHALGPYRHSRPWVALADTGPAVSDPPPLSLRPGCVQCRSSVVPVLHHCAWSHAPA